MSTIKHILSLNINEPIDQQMLLDYLEGKLSATENRIVEEWINNSPLASEAIDGLIDIEDKNQLPSIVKDLNHSMQYKLRQKHKRSIRLYGKNIYWFTIVLIITLLLCIIAFFVIRMLHYK